MKLYLKYISACLFYLLWFGHTQAQVSTDPAFPNGDQTITIFIDAKLAQDSRATGLLGLTEDVFLWSGAGSSDEGDAFEFGPPDQDNFNEPYEPGRMTFEGNDVWSITLTPRSYYNVPEGTPIEQLGVLLKNGDGSAQTEDFFIDLFSEGLNIALQQPTSEEFLANSGEEIAIEATTSLPANISLLVDGNLETQVSNASDFNYTLTVSGSGRQRAELIAENGSESDTVAFEFIVTQAPSVQALPQGVVDGINYVDDNTVILSLFAPNKSFVFLIGDFNNWTLNTDDLMNVTPAGDRFWLQIDNLDAGEEYAFQYVVFADKNNSVKIADPFADKILFSSDSNPRVTDNYANLKPYPTGLTDGPVSVLQTAQTPYVWQTTDFRRPAQEDLVIYELLVRDFDTPRNYQAVIDRLDYLQDLGVNAIELMPIMEFSGNSSWGYNPIFFFAPDKAYGTKNQLKALIDSVHARGMAVILDMVLNHADFEFPYVKMYFENGQPTNNPFFNPQATHPFSVFYDFNHESVLTQALADTINAYWLREYRFDGYRFDLSKGLTQTQSGEDVGLWSSRDESRIVLLKRMADKLWEVDSTAYVILEHFADNSEERELAEYRADEGKGMMLWGNMHGSFKQNAIGFANNSDIRGTYAQTLSNGGGRGWEVSHLIAYMESHDEERLMRDALDFGASSGSYNIRDLNTALDRIKAAAAFLYSIPGPKLFWQFGELGYEVSINENGRTGEKPIRWEYLDNTERVKLNQTMSELINLRNTYQVFKTEDVQIIGQNTSLKQIILRPENATSSPNSGDEMSVYLIGNFDVSTRELNANFPHTGEWYDYFKGSENAPFSVFDANMSLSLAPGEFRLYTNFPLPAPPADLLSFPDATPLSVEDQALSRAIQVFPNPGNGKFKIAIKQQNISQLNVEVIDQQGNVISVIDLDRKQQVDALELQLDRLPTGQYTLRFMGKNGFATKRIIKE